MRQNNFEYPNAEIAKKWSDCLIKIERDALMAQTQAFFNAGSMLDKVDVHRLSPVLIIHGEADRIYSPECSEKLAVEIETCTLHILKGKSHALFEDDQIVDKYINPFLEKI
jgi:pimeloyl-ACP methyl ester carboxylesterase